jgi:hypothetical protein
MKVKVVRKTVLIALENQLDIAAVHDALIAAKWCAENGWPCFTEKEKEFATAISDESLDYLIAELAKQGEAYGNSDN